MTLRNPLWNERRGFQIHKQWRSDRHWSVLDTFGNEIACFFERSHALAWIVGQFGY